MLGASAHNHVVVRCNFADEEIHATRPAVLGDVSDLFADRAVSLAADECGLMSVNEKLRSFVRANFAIVVEFVSDNRYATHHDLSPQYVSLCLSFGMYFDLLSSMLTWFAWNRQHTIGATLRNRARTETRQNPQIFSTS